eukprot:3366027-Pleurochrysis_carterae.AAC.1
MPVLDLAYLCVHACAHALVCVLHASPEAHVHVHAPGACAYGHAPVACECLCMGERGHVLMGVRTRIYPRRAWGYAPGCAPTSMSAAEYVTIHTHKYVSSFAQALEHATNERA